MSLVQCNQETAWYRQLGERLKAHWRFKLMATVVMTISFFSGYFLILYFPVFPVTEMPITAIDRLVGSWPNTLLVYITLWIYVPLGSWLLNDKREVVAYSKALCGLGMVGLAVFFFWPTSVPRPNIDVAEYPGFRLLVAIDEPRNVFPSLHAAFAVFSAICMGRLLRQLGDRGLIRGLNWCWCLSILYSTLATKQHLAVDLLAGTVLGAAWAGLYLRFFTRRRGGIVGVFSACPGRSTPATPMGSRHSSTSRIRAMGEAVRGDVTTPTPHRYDLAIHDRQQ
ncbi:MAG: phosphatase PAP2 family protein [Tepidisphaeraceae bacterium]|jgi:membrane-associated phospholipid phosphatase